MTNKAIKPNSAKPHADHGPRERWQHGGRQLLPTEDAGVLAAKNLEESILDRLHLTGAITEAARDAGLRLRQDYGLAKIEPRVTASYNPARSLNHALDGAHERSEAEEAAYRRWRHALRAVGIVDSNALVSVCCQEAQPRRAQLEQLRRGLARLVVWYGMQ